MEEKPTLFNSQMNQVSLLPPPPPQGVYILFQETSIRRHILVGASVNMTDQCFSPSENSLPTVDSIVPYIFPGVSVVLRLAYLIITISKCKSLNPFTLQRPVTASMYPCSPCDVIFLKGRGQLIYKYLLLGARS